MIAEPTTPEKKREEGDNRRTSNEGNLAFLTLAHTLTKTTTTTTEILGLLITEFASLRCIVDREREEKMTEFD